MKNSKALGPRLLALLLVLAVSFSSFAMFAFSASAQDSEAAMDEDGSANLYFISGNNDDEVILAGLLDIDLAPETLVIPEEFEGKKVAGIADEAFAGLESLVAVSLPATVTSVGARAFADCLYLEDIVFNGKLDYVGAQAFAETAWLDNYPTDFVYVNDEYKYLVAYKGTEKDVVLYYTTEKIAPGAFAGNDTMESVVLPERVESIGEGAFQDCSALKSVNVLGAISECGINAFENTPYLKEYPGEFVAFGKLLVKYVGNGQKVSVPNVFTRIADQAFWGSSTVLTVVLPATLETIGEEAFQTSAYTKPEIICYKGTLGHDYALANGYEIYAFMQKMGDYDNDGLVTAIDARSYLRFSAKLTDLDAVKDASVIAAGDMDGDGTVTASDARTVLRVSAKIEKFNENDLLNKPSTPFEVLNGYSQALRYAALKQAGYSLQEYQKMKETNLNANSQAYLTEFAWGLTKERKAKVQKFEPDKADAVNSLYMCELLNSDMIKSAKCTISGDYKYVYEITLKDEKAEFGKKSFTQMMFPVATKDDFQSILKSRWWYDLYAADGKLTYDITYTNCYLKAVVDVKTGRLESINMNMEYKITDIAGKLGGITIKDGKGNTNGNALRVDTVKYTDFVFAVPTPVE